MRPWVHLLWFLVAVAVMVVAGCAEGVSRAPMPTPMPVSVTALDLYSDYRANRLAADQKYDGKLLAVTGVVRDVGRDILGDPYVVLVSGLGYEFWGVQALFDRNYEPELAQLTNGQTVTVQGKVDGYLINVILKESVLVTVPSATAAPSGQPTVAIKPTSTPEATSKPILFSPVPTPMPTVPPSLASTRIAFGSNRGEAGGIYVMDVDGTNQRALTEHDGDGAQEWGPHGKKIAFASNRDGNAEIYVMNPDGSEQTRLTHNQGPDRFPSWSPDGSMIAFVSAKTETELSNIYVMNADGSNVIQVTSKPSVYGRLSWSPDGFKIAFTAKLENPFGTNQGIYTMKFDGSNIVRLVDGSTSWPSWSPDGTRIAFSSDMDIFVMNADGSGQARLTNDIAWEMWPSWSPDGTMIVFESWRDDNGEIYAMTADGSQQIRLTDNPVRDFTPSWSPFPK